MALAFVELHRASKKELLNEEWLLLENKGGGPINTAGCALTVAKQGERPRPIGTLDPGFVLQPGEKIRLVTGTASKKSQGAPPDESAAKNYHLFLREPIITRQGLVIRISLNQMELARTTT